MPALPDSETDSMRRWALAASSRNSASCAASSRTALAMILDVATLQQRLQHEHVTSQAQKAGFQPLHTRGIECTAGFQMWAARTAGSS